MLMMFGYFRPLLDSVSLTYWQSNPMVFLVYACLAAGFLLGLFTFSKFLSKISQNYKTPFYYTLAGLSCGSVVTMFYNPDIVPVYGQWAGGGFAAELCLGIVLFLAGALVSFVLVCFEQKKEIRRWTLPHGIVQAANHFCKTRYNMQKSCFLLKTIKTNPKI